MDFCPVCGAAKQNQPIICGCGYDFANMEIKDKVKIREYYNKMKSANNWVEEVNLVKKIHHIQVEKYGDTRPGIRVGWRVADTGKMLGKAKSVIVDSIKLANAVVECPEIKNIDKKSNASRKLKALNSGIIRNLMKPFETEKELQEYLEKNWEKIDIFKEWKFIEGQKHIGETGAIDILARHNSESKWIVIEIKKNRSSDTTVGQIQRYMGWVKENVADKNGEVVGLIISGYPPDENIRLALLATQNIDQQIYYIEKDQIKFIAAQPAYDIVKFEKLPIEKQKRLLEK